jgi:hypothetical protein
MNWRALQLKEVATVWGRQAGSLSAPVPNMLVSGDARPPKPGRPSTIGSS